MARGAQEQGFLVMRCPGLKAAETLTLIIDATLGFSFHSSLHIVALSIHRLAAASRPAR